MNGSFSRVTIVWQCRLQTPGVRDPVCLDTKSPLTKNVQISILWVEGTWVDEKQVKTLTETHTTFSSGAKTVFNFCLLGCRSQQECHHARTHF